MSDSCGFVDVGSSLWRRIGFVVYNCCWPSPEQSFSGPSPVGLVTVLCCLRFEASLFVASYDSRGYSGGIRHRLHTGYTGQFVFWSLVSVVTKTPGDPRILFPWKPSLLISRIHRNSVESSLTWERVLVSRYLANELPLDECGWLPHT
jgi:hypothetical protein